MTMNKNKLKMSGNLIFLMLYKTLIISTLVNAVVATLRQNNAEFMVSCDDSAMNVQMTFKYPFSGIVFVPEHYYDPTCSTENMETSGSTSVELSLSFLDCNTTIARFEGEDNLQAMNKVTVQFHPLIRSVLDCEIIATCDRNYPLLQDFFRSNLNRDMELPTPIDSKLDIMSAEKLFGEELSNILEVNGKQILVLNVTDGGKYVQLRKRKCYAHTNYVIDHLTDPYLLLEDNQCVKVGLLNWLSLKADKSYSDLRDFSEVQNFDLSFTPKTFYITCAFDRCLHSCLYSCFGETEINDNHWSTVKTHKVEILDKSFKGFRNRNVDLRASIKILSDRLLKLKERQIARKNNLNNSKRRSPRLDMAYGNASSLSQEKALTTHSDSNKLIVLDQEISTIYEPDISEDVSVVSLNQAFLRPSFESFICANLNSSEKKASGRIRSLSSVEETEFSREDTTIFEEETEFSINDDAIIDESPQPTDTDLSNESKILTRGIDCVNSGINCVTSGIDCVNSCMPNKVAKSTPSSENLLTNGMFANNSSFELDNAISSTSNNNLTITSNLKTDDSVEKDRVPYLKFSSVTELLSLLSVCFFIICL